MRYAIRALIYDRRRYLPGVLAVAFSALLIAMQVGLMMGLIGVVSIPIINSKADIWVTYPNTSACDLGRPIPNYWADRLWMLPEIAQADEYIQGFIYWKTPGGNSELIIVVGCNLEDDSLGPIAQLTPEQRARLTEPGAVILDRKDRHRLEVNQIGDGGEVSGQNVRVVGFTRNMGSLSGPYVVCSLPTARKMLRMRDDQTTYLLARCRDSTSVETALSKLRGFPKVSAFEAEEFSARSKRHWIGKTKAGVALGFAAILGLAVGASVTSQTLYSATAAAIKELAVLRALGIPRRRMNLFVLEQSAVVGVTGLALGLPAAYGLVRLANRFGTPAILPWWLVTLTVTVTLGMALASGLLALRSLRQADPAILLR